MHKVAERLMPAYASHEPPDTRRLTSGTVHQRLAAISALCVYCVTDVVKVYVDFSELAVVDGYLYAPCTHVGRTSAHLAMTYTVAPATRTWYVRRVHHTRYTQLCQLGLGQAAVSAEKHVRRDFADRIQPSQCQRHV